MDSGRWGVSQTKNTLSPNADFITVFWIEDTSLSLTWYAGQLYADNVYSLRIECNNTMSQAPFASATNYSGATLTAHSVQVSNSDAQSPYTDIFNYFVYTDYPNYPTGYAGSNIVHTRDIADNNSIGFNPSFSYEIDNLDVDLDDITPAVQLEEFHIDKCQFKIETTPNSGTYDTKTYDCVTKPTQSYTFAGFGNHNIIQRYLTADGEWFETSRVLNIDGSTYSGTIGDPSLTQNLNGFFGSLDTINTFGVVDFLTAPLVFYAQLPDMVNECGSISMPFLSSSFELICLKGLYYSNWSVSLFGLYETVLKAVTAFAIAVGIMRQIKTASSPHQGGIEVEHL